MVADEGGEEAQPGNFSRLPGLGGAGLDRRWQVLLPGYGGLLRPVHPGGKEENGLDINYAGIWNEREYDAEWIKLFRKTLDRAGLSGVGIVAADLIQGNKWDLAEKIGNDPALKASIHAIGAHYPNFKTTPAAQSCGLPLWSSEDGPWNGGWSATQRLARIYNRNYILGKMTKTEIWSPISAYYDNLPLPGSGVMRANTPWSGSYEVQPAVWGTAHTTQFARPGWRYIDSACVMIDGGSVVALRSPSNKDLSVIIETTEAGNPRTLVFEMKNVPPVGPLHVWRTTASDCFKEIEPAQIADGRFQITLEPGAIYSLTTLKSPKKGDAAPPPPRPFPLPYVENFESYQPGATPRYFSDYGGAFEVVKRTDGKGNALRQVIQSNGIEWQKNAFPETFIGDGTWKNYEVSVNVLVEKAGFASLFGRVGKVEQNNNPPWGFWLKADTAGKWELTSRQQKIDVKGGKEKKTGGQVVLASGEVAFAPNVWHTLLLSFRDDTIRASIDGNEVANVHTELSPAGMAGVGSGWHGAQFDHLSIQGL